MKAITLTQPWATLIAIGAKKIETRSWRRAYRGPLAIHAAKGFPREARELCHHEPFSSALRAAGIISEAQLPTGVIVATCHLVDIQPTEKLLYVTPHEVAFGDYSEKRFGWLLEDVQALASPYPPARGSLGLWDWEPSNSPIQPPYRPS